MTMTTHSYIYDCVCVSGRATCGNGVRNGKNDSSLEKTGSKAQRHERWKNIQNKCEINTAVEEARKSRCR